MALRDCCFSGDLRFGQRLRIPYQALVGIALARDLRIKRVRHLHIHFIHSPCNVGMYAAVAARLPFSVTAHANDLYVERSLIVEKGMRAAFLSTISEVNRSELKRLGVHEAKIRHLPCGVDTQWFDVKFRNPDANGRLLCVARLVEKKGVDLVIRALSELRRFGHRAHLRIVGDGPKKGALEELATELGVRGDVQFLGPLGRNRIRDELCAADAFVLPCRQDANGDRDGIPVVLMEAMAMGVPVLSTRISGIPELVIHGEGGLLVDPEDVQSLAESLDDLLSHPMEAASLGLEGQKRVLERHDQRVLAERLGHWISEIGQIPEETRRATGISVRVPRPAELRP
jgi:glycosyltransferase involved in cell wall biosynthesis